MTLGDRHSRCTSTTLRQCRHTQRISGAMAPSAPPADSTPITRASSPAVRLAQELACSQMGRLGLMYSLSLSPAALPASLLQPSAPPSSPSSPRARRSVVELSPPGPARPAAPLAAPLAAPPAALDAPAPAAPGACSSVYACAPAASMCAEKDPSLSGTRAEEPEDWPDGESAAEALVSVMELEDAGRPARAAPAAIRCNCKCCGSCAGCCCCACACCA